MKSREKDAPRPPFKYRSMRWETYAALATLVPIGPVWPIAARPLYSVGQVGRSPAQWQWVIFFQEWLPAMDQTDLGPAYAAGLAGSQAIALAAVAKLAPRGVRCADARALYFVTGREREEAAADSAWEDAARIFARVRNFAPRSR